MHGGRKRISTFCYFRVCANSRTVITKILLPAFAGDTTNVMGIILKEWRV